MSLNSSSHSLDGPQEEVANITIRTASKSRSPITHKGLNENKEKFEPLLGKPKVDLLDKTKPNSGRNETILIEHSDEKGPMSGTKTVAGKVLNNKLMQKLDLAPATRKAKQQQVRGDYAAAVSMLLGTNQYDRAALADAVSDLSKFNRKGLEKAIHAVDPDIGVTRSKEELSEDLYERVNSVSKVLIRDPNRNPPKLHIFLASGTDQDGNVMWRKPDPKDPSKTIPVSSPIALLQRYESKDGLPRYVKVLSLDRTDSKLLYLDRYHRPPAPGSTPPNTPQPLLTTNNQAVNDSLDDGDTAFKNKKYAEAGKHYKTAFDAYNQLQDATDDTRKKLARLACESYTAAFNEHKSQANPDPEIQWKLAENLEEVVVTYHTIEERMRGKNGEDGLKHTRLYDKFRFTSASKINAATRMLNDKIGDEKTMQERLANDYFLAGTLRSLATKEQIEKKSIDAKDIEKNLTEAKTWLEKSKEMQEKLGEKKTEVYATTLTNLAETMELLRDKVKISDNVDDDIAKLKKDATAIMDEIKKNTQNNQQTGSGNGSGSGSSSSSGSKPNDNNNSNQS
jgi:hypothetical protein